MVARLPSSASRSRSGSSSGSSSTSSSSLLVRAEGSAPGGIPGPLSLYRSRQTIIRMDSSSLHELDVLWPPLTFITRYRGGSRAILVNSLASSLKVGRIFSSIIQPGGGGVRCRGRSQQRASEEKGGKSEKAGSAGNSHLTMTM